MNKDIKDFLDYISNELNYSSLTKESYEKDLEEFLSFISKDLCKVDSNDIKKFINHLYEQNKSKNTISRKISSLKSFYNYMSLKDKINTYPVKNIKYPKKDKMLPKFLYFNELEEIFEATSLSKFPLRDRLIFEMLYATGVRVSELTNMKLVDINENLMEIRVLGKGSKERIVYFGEYAKDALDKYLLNERNSLLKGKKSEFLFINKNGTRITDRGIALVIDNTLKRASINTKISPHTLRHTFATHMLNEGCDLKVVQELLGHESIQTTQVYTHITSERLRNVYYKSFPRSGKNE